MQVNGLKCIIYLHRKTALTAESAVEEAIKNLPEVERENILSCLNTAKAKGPQGYRYTNRWLYQCILLKIRSPSAYQYIKENQIMAIPSITTIRR